MKHLTKRLKVFISIYVVAIGVIVSIMIFLSREKEVAVKKIRHPAAPNYTEEQRDSIEKRQLKHLIKIREERTLTAKELFRRYKNNEVAALLKFEKKQFFVEGYVEDIKRSLMDEIYVDLQVDQFMSSVRCSMQKDNLDVVANLQKHQKITVLGTCQGATFLTVNLTNCVIVKNKETLITELETLSNK